MIRKKEEIISKVLTEFLRNEGLETPLMEYRIVQAWPQVVGEAISRYTGNLFVKNGILNVKIKSAPLRQNLSMCQSSLTQKLNQAVGSQIISSIRFF
jgi:predicted nucleic acid-binding Zn ribbon protein